MKANDALSILGQFGTIKAKLTASLALILVVTATIALTHLVSAWEERGMANHYRLINTLAGALNEAAVYQALERGFGVLIIQSANPPQDLTAKFKKASAKADEKLAVAMGPLEELSSSSGGADLAKLAERWKKTLASAREARAAVEGRKIGVAEWMAAANANIMMEFSMRDLAFAPSGEKEQLRYYNTIIRASASTLAEYAGRERAGLLEALEKGVPISAEQMTKLERNRAIMDEASGRIMAVKDLAATPPALKAALEKYQREFLGAYSELREDLQRRSREGSVQISTQKTAAETAKARIEKHMASRWEEMVNLLTSANVSRLARALAEGSVNEGVRAAAEEDLYALSHSTREYIQLGFADARGKEIMRVDYDGEKFSRQAAGGLKTADGAVLEEARKLGRGGIYISGAQLNTAGGKIETPYRPVALIAAQVAAGGAPVGFITAKVSLSSMVEGLSSKGSGGVYLLDGNGYYLKHPDEAKQYGFAAGLGRQNSNMLLDYPDLAEGMLSKEAGLKASGKGGMFVWTPVFYSPSQRSAYWTLARAVKPVDYGVTSEEWMDRATAAIETVLNISNTVGSLSEETLGRITGQARWAIFGNLAAAVLSVALVAGALALVIYSVVNPLANAVSRLKDISEGAGDLTRRLEVKSADEVGDLAFWFNKFAEKTQHVLVEISYSAKTLASSSQEMAGVSRQLAAGSEQMTGKAGAVAGATDQMSASIGSMASAVEQMSANISAVSSGAEKMSQDMAVVAKKVEEMNASIQQIAAGSRKAKTVTGSAKERSAAASRAMNTLGSAAQEIGKVTFVIKRIAEQTNLLALNATIEAASAGAAGKGFAVVANEIKQLAGQSATAAEDIAKRIQGVQSSAENAVDALGGVFSTINEIGVTVEDISHSVEAQSRSSGEIATVVSQAATGAGSIARSISEIAKGAGEVSSSVGEAAKNAMEVASNIQVVRDSAEETSAGAQLVNNSSAGLSRIAGELDTMISKFKVS